MKNFVIVCVLLVGSFNVVTGDDFCKNPNGYDITGRLCGVPSCLEAIKEQVSSEIQASSLYLFLATLSDSYQVNRPGLTKFLYDGASEERQHGISMLDYLNRRGWNQMHIKEPKVSSDQTLNGLPSNIKDSFPYSKVLEKVQNKEEQVTNKIYNVIKNCSTEPSSDFHGADVFTDPIMSEQHDAIRQLRGLVKEYNNMMIGANNDVTRKNYAEFIVDQKLLGGEI